MMRGFLVNQRGEGIVVFVFPFLTLPRVTTANRSLTTVWLSYPIIITIDDLTRKCLLYICWNYSNGESENNISFIPYFLKDLGELDMR